MTGLDYKEYVAVGEHKILMPACPTEKNEVLFINEKDAYWRRDIIELETPSFFYDFVPYYTELDQDATLLDQDGNLKTLNRDDTKLFKRFIDQEMSRRQNGVWAKIKNKLVWITGDYYNVLRWSKAKRFDKKGDFFDFRRFQLEDSYLCYHAEVTEWIGGLVISKPKKTGITNLRWLYILNRATMTKNVNFGHMNLDQDVGAKTFRDHFLYAYDALPRVFQPKWKSKSENEGKIIFGKRYTNSKNKNADNGTELGTTVMCVPAQKNAFDVDVFSVSWYDEYPKYKSDFGEIYRSNNSATAIQDLQIGIKWLTSYTPEESGKSFFAGREIFYDSELRTIKPGNAFPTKSKMICHHIPAYQSWTSSFDKYGDCNEKDASGKIQAARDNLKDKPRELMAETRKYANTKKEAWSTGGVGSVFDTIRLGDLVTDIEIEELQNPEPLYIEGNLLWTRELWNIGLKSMRRKGEFCKVKFVPLTDEEKLRGEEGLFRFYYDIPITEQNLALNFGRDDWGNLLPPERFLRAMGGDPTNYAAASEVIEGSENAASVFSLPDERLDTHFRTVSSKRLEIEYFGRPELPDDAYEDFLKLIIFTGCICIVEANAPYVATRLCQEGLYHYMIFKNDHGIYTRWQKWMGGIEDPDKTWKLPRTTGNADNKDTLETFVRLYKNYWNKPAPGGKDYGKTIKSARWLKQGMDLDILNTKVFDLFMSGGWGLLTMEIYQELLLAPPDDFSNPNNLFAALQALQVH